MSKLTRRQLLIFFGSSAAATVLSPKLENLLSSNSDIAEAQMATSFTPVRLPSPVPAYTKMNSYLPTEINQGSIISAGSNLNLPSYGIIDDVVVPPEYERYVIVGWGDRVFPNQNDYFGYNNDYTAFISVNPDFTDGYLWVNHEYVSFPMSSITPDTPEDLAGLQTTAPLVIGKDLSVKNRETLGEFLYNLGGSIIRIRKNTSGRFEVIQDPLNRRIHGLSGLGINRQRSDEYQSVTAWGNRPGDDNYLIGTGPAATDVFPLSSDGLGNRIIGTAYNCSGGTTPWGTILSAEENYQGSEAFFVGVQENVLPNGTQTEYSTGTVGAEFGLVGEKYGWMVEVAPANPNFRPRKHSMLGRFRHENIAFRVETGRRLVGYMGDDRRGGHTYKFMSAGVVESPFSANNSSLFEMGTLYVAKFNPDGTGEWIPLVPSTPTNPVTPSVIASQEIGNTGKAQRDGATRFPKRTGIAGQTEDGGSFVVDLKNEATALPSYRNKQLADFYTSQGAILVDAFLASNLVGGTPCARPEDLEVHPQTGEVYIAYTDAVPGSDGYPDSRIFVVGKYSPAVNAVQPSGDLIKITETGNNPEALTFRWSRMEKGGEAGTLEGSGFANVDNLAFDNEGNVWGVTDMSTSLHNGFGVGANPEPREINHREAGSGDTLVGVFGNNWMFMVPMQGSMAGQVMPFAYGPPRCEMTGPTFIKDTLILAVQHPGEDVPIGNGTILNRDIEMLALDGTLFNQQRYVPLGSNWPSNIQGNPSGPPRPAVIGIRRKQPLPNGGFV